eukprot:scaffold281861_cov30-Tisochrysis_lutea.AAC.1
MAPLLCRLCNTRVPTFEDGGGTTRCAETSLKGLASALFDALVWELARLLVEGVVFESATGQGTPTERKSATSLNLNLSRNWLAQSA